MPPSRSTVVEYAPQEPPRLIVVVDTEEEFPWDQPHARKNTAVSAMADLHLAQDIFDQFDMCPTYVIDYPVASQEDGYAPLKTIAERGRCSIGAHLHPWVSPPFEEEVNARNSFPGNLNRQLEQAKLAELTETISNNFERPTIYKAGRYGVGPNTAEILDALGYEIDLSPTPGFSYASEQGPDFTLHPDSPYDFGTGQLCIPCTGGFVGIARGLGRQVYPLINSSLGTKLRLGGIAARLSLLERIRLSPEGFTLDELTRLSRTLFRAGVRTFTLSYHSPSLRAGCTPYVSSGSDLQTFLDTIKGYLEFFLEELGGRFSTPGLIRADLMENSGRE